MLTKNPLHLLTLFDLIDMFSLECSDTGIELKTGAGHTSQDTEWLTDLITVDAIIKLTERERVQGSFTTHMVCGECLDW